MNVIVWTGDETIANGFEVEKRKIVALDGSVMFLLRGLDKEQVKKIVDGRFDKLVVVGDEEFEYRLGKELSL